ncbi:hypothetical protein Tco_0875405 [Tanacetum coccineum]|uniref:Uncharacterized protein n=1 Tax=Tanacetum coccineum TaxID=301880 RepID=A0ABQ5BR39_9ASTR
MNKVLLSGQQDWKIVTWRLYESCGICILEFEDGIVIHDVLLKEVGFSTHHAVLEKEMASPRIKHSGKDKSKLLISE